MKIGITGSTGVLGRHFINQFKDKADVSCFHDRVESKIALMEWIEKEKPEILYHFASKVPVKECEENPSDAMQTNVVGTLRLLEALKKYSPNCWVFIPSTCHVYKPSFHKLTEKSKTEPVNFYGLTKLFQEECAGTLAEKWGLRICIGRIFSFSGEGQSGDYFFPSLISRIRQAKKNETLSIYGKGNIRDFLDAEEIVKCLYDLGKKRALGILNIASGRGLKIEEIAIKVRKILNRSDLQLKIQKNNRPNQYVGNVSKLKKQLNYTPEFNLRETVLKIARSMGHP